MEKGKQKFGVALYHLKGKFAYGSTNGNEMTEFKFNESQISALFRYLHEGVFEGMFNQASIDDYWNILNLNYMNLTRESLPNDAILKLKLDFEQKAKELEEAYDSQVKSKQTQPE